MLETINQNTKPMGSAAPNHHSLQPLRRWPALAMFLAFLLPLALAYLVLKMQWFQAGSSNSGELLKEDIYITTDNTQLISGDASGFNYWNIAYWHSDTKIAPLMDRTYIALGKHQSHVNLLALQTDNTPLSSSSGEIYLLDQQGLVVMRYTVNFQHEHDQGVIKGLLKDTQKLLKYRRN